MNQKIPVVVTVSFPDECLQKDVDEALEGAMKQLQSMVGLMPKLPGRSATGKKIAFTVESIEPTRGVACLGRCNGSNPCVFHDKHTGDHVCTRGPSCGCVP